MNVLPSTEPRLNPFAFPKETDFRFLLLIVAVAGASLFVYADLYNTLFGSRFSAADCVVWMLGGSSFTLAVAVVLYWMFPQWKRMRGRLRRLGPDDIPGLYPYLLDLAREAAVPSPTFLWNALDQTKEGFAFGRWGDLYVYLPRGLISDYTHNRPEFRAVVLHELAHLHNGDVHKTYLSYAVWWAFLVTAVPVFAVSLLQSPPVRMVGMGLRVMALFFLIYLTRNAVLRVREFYADLRASLWDRESSALRLAIATAQTKADAKNRWQRLWLTHPPLRERGQVLQNPSPLFDFGFWEAFATGMAVMIPFTNLVAVIGLALLAGPEMSGLYQALLLFLIPAMVVAGLMVYIVGAGIWRMTFAATAQQQPVRGISTLGLGLSLGIVVGLQFSFLGASSILPNPVYTLLWLGLLVSGLTPFLAWIALGARSWFGLAVRSPSPRPFYRWGLLLATGLLACIFASLFAALIAFSAESSPFNLAVHNPLMGLALSGLWAFPLLACLQQSTAPQLKQPSWLFLDQSPTLSIAAMLNPRALRWPLGVGLAVGLLGGGLVAALSTSGYATVGNLLRAAMLIEGLAGAVTAAFARQLSSIVGLFAAAIAGLVTVTGYVLLNSYLGPGMVAFVAMGMINSGGLLAIPVVLIVATFSSGLQRLLLHQA